MDLIAHRGEPQNGAPDNSGTPGVQVQKITPDLTPEFETLRQENGLLRRRIEELEADQEDWKGRERDWKAERSRLQGIIERQTYALPKPQSEGVFAQLVQWVQGRCYQSATSVVRRRASLFCPSRPDLLSDLAGHKS